MRGDRGRQQGYALVETGLAMALLLALGVGVALLGEWHGHGLRAAHASRLQAFHAARGGDDRTAGAGAAAQAPGYAVSLHAPPVVYSMMRPSGPSARPAAPAGGRGLGGKAPSAGFSMPGGAATAALRRDWGMARDGLVLAYARVDAVRRDARTGVGRLRRHTALIGGAGHAAGDRQAQARIAGNRAAWRRAADGTVQAGRRIGAGLHRIDAGWGRAAPEFDWLSRWADLVPAERIGARAGGRARASGWLARELERARGGS